MTIETLIFDTQKRMISDVPFTKQEVDEIYDKLSEFTDDDIRLFRKSVGLTNIQELILSLSENVNGSEYFKIIKQMCNNVKASKFIELLGNNQSFVELKIKTGSIDNVTPIHFNKKPEEVTQIDDIVEVEEFDPMNPMSWVFEVIDNSDDDDMEYMVMISPKSFWYKNGHHTDEFIDHDETYFGQFDIPNFEVMENTYDFMGNTKKFTDKFIQDGATRVGDIFDVEDYDSNNEDISDLIRVVFDDTEEGEEPTEVDNRITEEEYNQRVEEKTMEKLKKQKLSEEEMDCMKQIMEQFK